MFFIFGWGKQTRKDFGPVNKLNCSHCGRDEYWHLVRSITWATLFFIPIIPYSIEKFILCPICQYGIQLDDKKFNELRAIAEANQMLLDGKITELEHNKMLNLPTENNQVNGDVAEETEVSEATSYCHMCGKEVAIDAIFCKFCGNKLS